MTAREAYDPARHGRDTPQATFGPEVLVDRAAEGRIHVITLNRPHRLNALGGDLRVALYDAWTDFRDDPTARVAILTGAGRAFSAGADLIEGSGSARRGGPLGRAGPRSRRVGPRPVRAAMTWPRGMGVWKPVIGAITGPPSRAGSRWPCRPTSA